MISAQSWTEFVRELQSNILPIYQANEDEFDSFGVHGRMHICRALIYGEYMGKYYRENIQNNMDLDPCRYAIAFHDAGRKGNGPDIWEKDSVRECLDYLISVKSLDIDHASQIANLINKKARTSIWKNIVHDADVLEIMRPCGHGGRVGFKFAALRFGTFKDPLGNQFLFSKQLRRVLVNETWEWIIETEAIKEHLRLSQTYMEEILQLLISKKQKYPSLSSII